MMKEKHMKRLNKKLALAMLSLGFAALTPSAASANIGSRDFDPCCPDPCRTDCCPSNDCCSFDFGAEFLYWKPCVDDLDYSATVAGDFSDIDNPRHIRYNGVCPDWEPGFRLTISKEDCWKCFDLSFSYTWLNSDDAQSARGGNGEFIAPVGLHPFLVEENPAPDFFFDVSRGKWEFNYQTFDILFSYPFRCGSCHTLTPFFGVEIVKFDQEWKSRYEYNPNTGTSTVALIDWESDFKGAGLKLGTDYKYFLCEGFSLFARAAGAIVVGDSSTDNDQVLFDISDSGTLSNQHYFRFKDDDCCHFIPGWHLQLGFMFEDESCGCEYTLRIGYEMVQWYNLQNPRRWFEAEDNGNIAQSIQSNTTTVGFHGLLAGIEVKF